MEKVEELAQYLQIDPKEIDTVDNSLFDTPVGDYAVYTEEEAYEAAKNDIESIMDDLGLMSFTKEFRDRIMREAIDENAVDEFIEQEIDYLSSTGDESDAEVVDMLYNLDSTEGKLEYIRDAFYDDKDFYNNWAKDNLDLDKVVDMAIEEDGLAHFISYYDGEEIELPNYFAYRVN